MFALRAVLRSLVTLSFISPAFRLPVYGLLGVAVGLGLLTVRASELPSYLSDDPRTCINCHIMSPQYITWQRGSHHAVAVCNDCHVPHDALVKKYAFKAKDGMRHAAIFTLRAEPQVIRAHAASQRVIDENCQRCHGSFVSNVPSLHAKGRRCIDCHRATPHGDVHSLASTPAVPFPRLTPITGRSHP